MYRAMFMCIALAMASPAAAQQTTTASPEQVPPPASELPPPPPFPHYPKIAPREHDPNWHRPTRSHAPSHSHRPAKAHHASPNRAKTHRQATTHRRATAHHGAKRQYFSKRTIRQCHRMSYSQIMGHKYCRMMMKQDIAAKARDAHHAPRHRAAYHKKARRHRG